MRVAEEAAGHQMEVFPAPQAVPAAAEPGKTTLEHRPRWTGRPILVAVAAVGPIRAAMAQGRQAARVL